MAQHSSATELLPTTYLVVLTLVGRGAKYGYEINSQIERHGYRNWVDMKFSSIYKALNELEVRGLIRGTKENPSVKTSRKMFSLTPKGRRILRKQVIGCLSNPPQSNTLFDLGLSAMFFLRKEDVLAALSDYRSNLNSGLTFLKMQIDTVRNLEQLQETNPSRMIGNQKVSEFDGTAEREVVLALFERPARGVESQLQWLDEFIKRVENGDGFSFKE